LTHVQATPLHNRDMAYSHTSEYLRLTPRCFISLPSGHRRLRCRRLLLNRSYTWVYATHCKGRWVGRSVIEVFAKEFQDQTREAYEEAILAGECTIPQPHTLPHLTPIHCVPPQDTPLGTI
jgi:hypothetical protein